MVRPNEMKEILRQVGWTDGFNIPALNDENRCLEAEVAAMLREKASLMTSEAELGDLLGSLKSHTVELENESTQIEALLTTQQHQLESEDTLIKVLQGEQSRLNNAILAERQERKSVEERCKKIEQQLRTSASRSNDLLGVQEHWQRQETLASLTTNTLAEFYKQDEGKLKELELQRLRLQDQVTAATRILHQTNGNVVALEQQLETSANQYKTALAAKGELADRWKLTANSMRVNEETCRALKQEVSELGLVLSLKEQEQREARELEENEQRKNREIEAHSRLVEHDLAKFRETLRDKKTISFALNEEVNSLQCHLAGCGSDLAEQRKRSQDLAKQIKEREEQKDVIKHRCAQRKDRLADLDHLTGDSEKRNQRLEAMAQEKARAVCAAEQELQRIENETFKSKQEASKVKLAIDNSLVAVNAEEVALRQTNLQKSAVEKLLDRHRDMLLSVDLDIQRAEFRLQKIANDKAIDEENSHKLAEKEILLKESLVEKQANLADLERDLRSTETSERKIVSSLGTVQAQLTTLQAAEKAYWAEVEGGEVKVARNKGEVDQSQVKLSLVCAKVSKRNEELVALKSDVLRLKNTALQADRVGKLQGAETAADISAMVAEVNGAESENTELKMAINKRKLRLHQLQGVYDMTIKSMEGSGAEDIDSIECITKQQIRVAQEKGELVQKGNQLDMHIRTAEQEIQAMEHTLALVKSANDKYRTSLALPGAPSADSEDPDMLEKIQSEEEKQKVLRTELKKRKEAEAKIYEKCQYLREELAETEEKYQELITGSAERKHEVFELERDIAEQDIKLRRAVAQARRLRRELRAGNPGPTYEERDLEVREMKRVTSAAIKQLWELGPEARPLVVQYLQEKGLPCDPPSLHQVKLQPFKSPTQMSVSSHGD